jgi:GH15 family glucan-1,4-alpha-glucosidase
MSAARPDYLPIERYGAIGESGTAALVSDDGSIDWLCLPEFDSDPVFARLLDPYAGHWSVRPSRPFRARQRYLPRTAVLATTFETERGRATLFDFFGARGTERKDRSLWPSRYLVRRAVGEAGRVPFHVEFAPRDAFRQRPVRLAVDGHRLLAASQGRLVIAESTRPFEARPDRAVVDFELGEGERYYAALATAHRDPPIVPPVGDYAERVFQETVEYWRAWTERIRPGPTDPEAVIRGLISLKLLTFAPSGGIIAAPTTSLPERIGGVRNWDYRHVWIRDASRGIRAMLDHGFWGEAHAYMFWIVNAASLTRPRVNVLYDLYGRHRIRERSIEGLRGYLDSKPVRRGNAAVDQLQLDNYGYMVDAARLIAERTGRLEPYLWREVRPLVQFVARSWRTPDSGIWEVRSEPRHFVHSKVLCWAALDVGIRLARRFRFRAPLAEWERERDLLHREVLLHGFDRERGTFVRSFGEPIVDSSLLEIPWFGFLPGDDPRILSTIERVREELKVDAEGLLLYRYTAVDGLPGDEGAFLPCSYWLVRALALAGRTEEAEGMFRRLAKYANACGLLPEEIDPKTGHFLGNFPLGLCHSALLNAEAAIREARGEPAPTAPPSASPMGATA